MQVRFLGAHNAESKGTRLVSVLIDEVLAVDAGNIASELTFAEQRKIKAILLSHGHYDHIRGIPAFAFNNIDHTTFIYGPSPTLKMLSTHLVDGVIYPEFTKRIPFFIEEPSLEFVTLDPFVEAEINGYNVRSLPVNHTIYAVGYEIINKHGKSLFYSGDTGPGLSALWGHISPDLLLIETTFPNRFESRAINSKHLCPKMLHKELKDFLRQNGTLPKIILMHLSPECEQEITKEVAAISKELKHPIEIAYEGMTVTV